jgi:hypothetical protein
VQYQVEAKSREDLRNLALSLRKKLKLDNEMYFPIVKLLDVFTIVFSSFDYEIVDDSELDPEVHAETDVVTGKMLIKQSIYDRAYNGEGRDRMTIAHEIGHYFTICECGFKLSRCYKNKKPITFRDPEWQAKCFAGELTVPAHLMYNKSVDEIIELCGVSEDAAIFQYNKMHNMKGCD